MRIHESGLCNVMSILGIDVFILSFYDLNISVHVIVADLF